MADEEPSFFDLFLAFPFSYKRLDNKLLFSTDAQNYKKKIFETIQRISKCKTIYTSTFFIVWMIRYNKKKW